MFCEYLFDTSRKPTVVFFPGDLNRKAADVVGMNCLYQSAKTMLARTIAPFVEGWIARKKIRHVKRGKIELFQNIHPSPSKSFPGSDWTVVSC